MSVCPLDVYKRQVCCGFKTESGTGGGFEEKSGDYSAIQNFTVRLLFKLFCHLQELSLIHIFLIIPSVADKFVPRTY